MTRLFCVVVALVAVAGLTAPNAWAAVPDVGNSYVTFYPQLCDSTKGLLCPDTAPAPNPQWSDYCVGYVRDQFNLPMGGRTVTLTFSTGCAWYLCAGHSLQATTDVNGEFRINMPMGLDYGVYVDGFACCSATTTVTCLGVTLDERTKDWLSVDMNGSGSVNSSDLQYVLDDWNNNTCFVDYDCSGATNSSDLQYVLDHWNHQCR